MNNVYQRIHSVMRQVGYIQKRQPSNDLPYTYVSHDDVVAALRPAMVEHGLVAITTVLNHTAQVVQVPSRYSDRSDTLNFTTATVQLDIVNVDDPTDRVTVQGFGYGIDRQDKGPGKAISYACKMILLKTFMLETGDEPENDNISCPLSAAHPPVTAGVIAPEGTTHPSPQPAQTHRPPVHPSEDDERRAILREVSRIARTHRLTPDTIRSILGKPSSEMTLDELRACPVRLIAHIDSPPDSIDDIRRDIHAWCESLQYPPDDVVELRFRKKNVNDLTRDELTQLWHSLRQEIIAQQDGGLRNY